MAEGWTALSPRAARTRSALLAAGFQLLSERPIDAIAIDDIVARAGVAKGSFFNHFTDKHAFAAAIAVVIREQVEARIDTANAGVSDPVQRLAGGMRVAVAYALEEPQRCAVLVRMAAGAGSRNPLNSGLRADLEACRNAGVLRAEAGELGLMLWLGACQMLIVSALEHRLGRADAAERLREMLVLGLTGLGVREPAAQAIAAQQAKLLRASPEFP